MVVYWWFLVAAPRLQPSTIAEQPDEEKLRLVLKKLDETRVKVDWAEVSESLVVWCTIWLKPSALFKDFSFCCVPLVLQAVQRLIS